MAIANKSKGKTAKKKPARPVKHTAKKRTAPKAMDEQAMMAAWQKAMTPSAGHARLEKFVGAWDTRMTFVMEPGVPPEVSQGKSENRWVLGGRYLEQRFEGTSMGMPFEGIGYTAYDNIRGKYIGTWMDNFGTGMMTSDGVGKPTDKKMESELVAFEPSGKRVRFTSKVLVKDRDHHTYEMWTKGPKGKMFRTMLIEYTRKA